jgi:hypothetical protein
MLARQPRKTPGHQQHDDAGCRKDERHHATHMFGWFLRVEIHAHRGRHSGDRNSDGIPGAGALEQDSGWVDRRARFC